MSDIVQALRALGKEAALASFGDSITWQAADEIERLRSEVTRLRADLKWHQDTRANLLVEASPEEGWAADRQTSRP